MKFCPNNAITKIEAAAIILRSAYLWNEELDQKTTNPRNTPNGLDPKWAHYLEKTREYNIWGSSLEGISWNTPLTSEERAQLLSRLSSIQPICPSSANTSLGGLGVQIRASVDG